MKTIRIQVIFSILLFAGLQKVQAQTHPKVKAVEHAESIPAKEPEIKKESSEAIPVNEHTESAPAKEPVVKMESQPAKNAPVESHAAEKPVMNKVPIHRSLSSITTNKTPGTPATKPAAIDPKNK